METGPRADLVKKHQKEFEEKTGIKVGIEIIPEQQAPPEDGHRAQLGQAVVRRLQHRLSRAEAADREGRLAARHHAWTQGSADDAGRIRVRRRLQARAGTTPPDATARSPACRVSSIYFMLYCNKELFAKKGVAVPQDDGRDDGRGGQAATIRPTASPAMSAAACATPTCRCGRSSSRAGARRRPRASRRELLTDTPDAIAAAEILQEDPDRLRRRRA